MDKVMAEYRATKTDEESKMEKWFDAAIKCRVAAKPDSQMKGMTGKQIVDALAKFKDDADVKAAGDKTAALFKAHDVK